MPSVMRFSTALLGLLIASSSTPAAAELREFCASRPGIGTPPCTTDPGHVVIEVGVADWTRETDDSERKDSFTFGDVAVRIGVDAVTEVQVGWTAFGLERTRDLTTGDVARSRGFGDVTIGVRRSLSGPDGPVALQPYVTVPVGGRTLGAGDWGFGVIAPISFDLGGDIDLALSPQVEAAVDEDRSGRHLRYGSVVGLSAPISAAVTGTIEFQAMRDDDPAAPTTMLLGSFSLAWLAGDDTQLDAGVVAGLNADSPDLQLYLGISRRF